jgi:putative oxidoreductase
MAAFMQPFAPQIYAALRILAGLMFLCHGLQKLVGWPLPMQGAAPAWVVYLGGGIELFGGALVAIGLATRWAAFLCAGMMAVAFWGFHAAPALGQQGLFGIIPLVNKGEPAALYCFVFLYIAARGAGIWSADGTRAAS